MAYIENFCARDAYVKDVLICANITSTEDICAKNTFSARSACISSVGIIKYLEIYL